MTKRTTVMLTKVKTLVKMAEDRTPNPSSTDYKVNEPCINIANTTNNPNESFRLQKVLCTSYNLPAKTRVMPKQKKSAYSDSPEALIGNTSLKALLIALSVRASKLALKALATLAVPKI